jgi:hypothetical protein
MKYTKQTIAILFVILFTNLFFIACKKKVVTPPTVVGVWKGQYLELSTNKTGSVTYVLKEDKSMLYYNSLDTANATNKYSGIYSLVNNRLLMGYTLINGNLTYMEEAVLNASWTHFDGTWGNGNNASDGGTTKADKQ